MNEGIEEVQKAFSENIEKEYALLGKLATAASPEGVYGQPVTAEGHTVITASEVTAVLWSGFGYGSGPQAAPSEDAEEKPQNNAGGGGGSGGGGFSGARPVAVISIGADGVRVEPVVDVTKISLAFFTTFAAIIATVFRIQRRIYKRRLSKA